MWCSFKVFTSGFFTCKIISICSLDLSLLKENLLCIYTKMSEEHSFHARKETEKDKESTKHEKVHSDLLLDESNKIMDEGIAIKTVYVKEHTVLQDEHGKTESKGLAAAEAESKNDREVDVKRKDQDQDLENESLIKRESGEDIVKDKTIRNVHVDSTSGSSSHNTETNEDDNVLGESKELVEGNEQIVDLKSNASSTEIVVEDIEVIESEERKEGNVEEFTERYEDDQNKSGQNMFDDSKTDMDKTFNYGVSKVNSNENEIGSIDSLKETGQSEENHVEEIKSDNDVETSSSVDINEEHVNGEMIDTEIETSVKVSEPASQVSENTIDGHSKDVDKKSQELDEVIESDSKYEVHAKSPDTSKNDKEDLANNNAYITGTISQLEQEIMELAIKEGVHGRDSARKHSKIINRGIFVDLQKEIRGVFDKKHRRKIM